MRLDLHELFARVASGQIDPADAARTVDAHYGAAVEGLADAVPDPDRDARTGTAEVVLGQWKTAAQIADILPRLASRGHGALATRVDADKAAAVAARVPGLIVHADAHAVELPAREPRSMEGTVCVVAAGTSDLPVVAEAEVAARYLGLHAQRIVDVGVAGLHRLLARLDDIRTADVVIAVAGMEAALPSVLAGLVKAPVIAVPTSIGYGVGAGGWVAMAGMLTSCSPGIAVVNIDNGVGAAMLARRIVAVGRAGAHLRPAAV